MDLLLELAKSKVTVRYLAKNLELSQAEKMCRDMRETIAYLERRIVREKLSIAKNSKIALECATEVSLTN